MNNTRLRLDNPQPCLSDLAALARLPAEQLLGRLEELVAQSNAITARLLAHLGEVDARKLYAQAACSSMFIYCVQVLGLSEGASYKRITAARAARRFPLILELVHQGRLHLSGACLLAPHLSAGNAEELLGRARGKSKRQIERLLAELFPAPDVPPSVRALPQRCEQRQAEDERSRQSLELPLTAAAAPAPSATAAAARSCPEPTPPEAAAPSPPATSCSPPAISCSPPATSCSPPATSCSPPATSCSPQPATARRDGSGVTGQVTPLAPRRYKVQLTASESLHAKLREAQELLGHQVPPGDLAAVLERALDALLPVLRRQRFGVTSRPRRQRQGEEPEAEHAMAANPEAPARGAGGDRLRLAQRSRTIPAQVKRDVARRDGYRCTFVDPATGRRCHERSRLEYHHEHPWALGGSSEPNNIRLLCRVHNRYLAEQDYGSQLMGRYQRGGQAVPGDGAPPGPSASAPPGPSASAPPGPSASAPPGPSASAASFGKPMSTGG